jgi:outer membrane usher protein FimD/PapC
LSETTSRTVADSSLQASINAEATAREIADSSLQANISIWNTYTTASASAAVINRDQVFWDTTGGVCTATLPATPSLGATVRLIDFKGTWGTNKLVIARNGNKIQGASADLDLTVPWDSLTLVFDGVDNWHLLYS